MRLMISAIASLALVSGSAVASTELVLESSPAELNLQGAAQPEAAAQPAAEKTWLQQWDGSVELGLNGSEGNTQNLNFRGAITAERKVEKWDSKAILTYLRSQQDSTVTKNRFEAAFRQDYKFEKGSPWRLFGTATYEYDDFQDWQHRVQLFGGVGYAFIENEKTTLVGRAGAGATRKFGGEENAWIPEALVGADFEHKFNDRQKITAMVEIYPSLKDSGEYRAKLKAAYELIVDPSIKMSLKVGVEDRYDSQPGPGQKRNDLEYFALLVWAF